MTTTARTIVAAISLLGIYFGAEVLKGHGMPTELADPQLQLAEMPWTFGSWTGKKVPLDPSVFQAIGAEMAINRRYESRSAAIDLHSDMFLRYGVRTLHPPELCYSSNGFTVDSSETLEIFNDGKASHSARLLTLSRENVRIFCLFWYQVADTTFWEGDGQRRVVQSFRGKKVWPPMIKVMLQTSASSPEEAQKQLKSMAALVYPWTRAYH